MGTTCKIWRVDDEGRLVFEGEEEAEELGLDEDGHLDLDQAWPYLEAICEAAGGVSPFDDESLDEDATKELSTQLRPLKWPDALELARDEFPDEDAISYAKPYYQAFRKLVLRASKEGTGLHIELL